MKRLFSVGAVVGLFVIMMITASMQGTPTIMPPHDPLDLSPAKPLEESSSPMPSMEPLPPDPASDAITAVVGSILLALLAALVAVIVVLVVRAIARAWQERPMKMTDGIEVGGDLDSQSHHAEPESVAPAIRRGIAGALHVIDDRAVANDAIVAAWLGLEESAEDAGMTRGASETPAEFALRIMSRRAGITEAARELLRLYERVRFGGYEAVESDRDSARASLRRIEEGWR